MSREDSSLADLALLGKLWAEHAPRLLAMLRRRLDPALAARLDPEELLNEAFLMARRRWNDFKARSPMTPYAWLYRIALDCLIEAYRRENRACRDPDREMSWPEQSSIQLGLNLVSSGTSPSGAAARAELQRRMQQTLELLGSRDRQILWMRHYEDLSFAEAADVLGITENAASVRYVRALKRLKKLWQAQHDRE